VNRHRFVRRIFENESEAGAEHRSYSIARGHAVILVAEAITQNAFGGGSSRQEIVDLFNSSQTIEQRVMIIVLAWWSRRFPKSSSFAFSSMASRARYFGIAVGLVFNAFNLCRRATHLPSAVPLFVLGAASRLPMNGAGRFWFQWPCILLSIPFNWSFSPFLTGSAMKRRRSASGRTRLGEVEDALIASLLRGLPVPRGVIAVPR